MPTKRRRHAVTETQRVQDALDLLRRTQGYDRLDVAELVILGAEQKLAQLMQSEERLQNRHELADRIRSAALPMSDVAAAEEVRRRGWVES